MICVCLYFWTIFSLKLKNYLKMGEAKRREKLGLPPREKKFLKEDSNSKLNQILNKYPYFPYILGFSILIILVIDLFNYYKWLYLKVDECFILSLF